MSIESIGEHRFRRDIERIVAVGSAYTAVIVEVREDVEAEVRRLIWETIR